MAIVPSRTRVARGSSPETDGRPCDACARAVAVKAVGTRAVAVAHFARRAGAFRDAVRSIVPTGARAARSSTPVPVRAIGKALARQRRVAALPVTAAGNPVDTFHALQHAGRPIVPRGASAAVGSPPESTHRVAVADTHSRFVAHAVSAAQQCSAVAGGTQEATGSTSVGGSTRAATVPSRPIKARAVTTTRQVHHDARAGHRNAQGALRAASAPSVPYKALAHRGGRANAVTAANPAIGVQRAQQGAVRPATISAAAAHTAAAHATVARPTTAASHGHGIIRSRAQACAGGSVVKRRARGVACRTMWRAADVACGTAPPRRAVAMGSGAIARPMPTTDDGSATWACNGARVSTEARRASFARGATPKSQRYVGEAQARRCDRIAETVTAARPSTGARQRSAR